ncbi:Apj1p LALA0_S04e08262g [Lachancea lanzarotensis]|uniref:LALA0S04e08262g1_1 n=1 Tax=Lachancea lanzarotensis TaxID=1245769 RepID=A0A0C7N6H6_9SACH|nr:uncharacterized protein LALA0_S04e08262g [Lachancea lanzarotensis]CEP62119.1 LALA0S04e08262g1_1 [Lachancea lanzarotensis]
MSSSVDNSSLYEVLGVSREASKQEIKKAYRVKALRFHPDKNGHSEEAKFNFQKVSDAYNVLQDDHKRTMYDRTGTADESQWSAMKPAEYTSTSRTGRGMSAGDLFAQFFGGGATTNVSGSSFFGNDMDFFGFNSSRRKSGRQPRQSRPKTTACGPDIRHRLKCSLDELYHGKTTKLALNRTRLCRDCNGEGSAKITTCKLCGGRGMRSQTRRQGHMTQSWSSTCNGCGGQGTFCAPEDTCITCQGKGCICERKIFDMQIEKGMEHGQEIILPGEADEVINTSYGTERVVPGDVIVTMEQLPNSKFKRDKDASFILEKCPVALKTSLCGGPVWISSHPSGKIIKVDVLPGEILKPGDFKCVENLGMPDGKGGFGNLYIGFEVVYPTTMNVATINGLAHLLEQDGYIQESEKNLEIPFADADIVEEHVLSDFVSRFEKRRSSWESENSWKRHKNGGCE